MSFFKKFLPKSLLDQIRSAVLFRAEDPNNLHQVLPQRHVPVGVERIKGFRYPAPGSQPAASIPTRESVDNVYDIKYFSRDPRNIPRDSFTYINAKSGPKLITDRIVRDGSAGSKIPAVMAYDPTGLRSTMTASWAELDKALEKVKPNHLPAPAWAKDFDAIVAECERKGIPCTPGRRFVYPEGTPSDYNQVRW